MNRWLTSVLFAALLLCATSARGADPSTRLARQHYQEGTSLYREARYPEAIEAFKAAYAVKHNGVVFFNIAQCYEKLGDLPNALESYRRYLTEVPAAEDRSTVETVISNLQTRVQALKNQTQDVRVSTEPSGAAVEVEQTARGTTPLEMKLGPGTYAVRVTRDGFVPVDRSITVSNAPVQLELTLSPLTNTPPLVDAAALQSKEGRPHRRVWTWVAVGVGGASVLGAATMGGLAAQSQQNYFKGSPPTRGTIDGYEKSARGQATASNVLWGVGGGLLAVGATLFFIEGRF